MSGKSPAAQKGERIAKTIARAGMCSRREAEAWIAAGRVAVNGAVIASPALNVGDHDRITIDGNALPGRERTRLFLYHKPRGLVTTHSDPEGRPTIFAALPKELPRLISVGRLDLGTEGLLLLTNDGGLARVLELPATGWLRRYRVRAHGTVTQAALDELRDGIAVDGIQYGEIEATLDRQQGANVWLTFAIREGKNREVRNVLRALDLSVNRLIRVSFGPFQLAELPEGGIEEVKTRTLRDQLGERLTRLAGADFSAVLTLPFPSAPVVVPASRGEGRRQKRAGTETVTAPAPEGRKPRAGGKPDTSTRHPPASRGGTEKPGRPSGRPAGRPGEKKPGAAAPQRPQDQRARGGRKPRPPLPPSPEKPRPEKQRSEKWRPEKRRRRSQPRDRGKK